jgi:predicted nucleic acid-binding protein
MRIYLDNCCFNRPFDDQTQKRIQLETIAKLYIQNQIRKGVFELVWSYMNDYENGKNPYIEQKNAIQIWENIAKHICQSSDIIWQKGMEIEKLGIGAKDALHIVCAIESKCDYFITTDKVLLKRKIDEICIINPIEFIMRTED